MTIIMQSSAAVVATTLTALHAETIDFEIAAIMVIGAAIGTTMTGVLAALGGSIYAKRTALAHVLFNLASGIIAMLLLPVLLAILGLAQTHLGLQPGGVSLAAFHTLFIAVGVAVFLPHAQWCARQIERLLPEKSDLPTRLLDQSQWQVPVVALSTSHEALRATATRLLGTLSNVLVETPGEAPMTRQLPPDILPATAASLEQMQSYLSHIPLEDVDDDLAAHRLSQMHVLDHLLRLHGRAEQLPSLLNTENTAELLAARRIFTDMLNGLLPILGSSESLADIDVDALAGKHEKIAALRQQARRDVMQQTAAGQRDPGQALRVLDSMLWLERTAHHVWRICHYLQADEAVRANDREVVGEQEMPAVTQMDSALSPENA